MFVHPQFDPVAFSLGPLALRWYGLMYLVAFALFAWVGRAHARRLGNPFSGKDLDDLLFYGVIGVILGGRLGYVLFYKPAYYAAHPAEILAVWQGGMSFHGGFLGALAAMWFFARKSERRWFEVADFVAPLVPLGLAAGRLGNFINAELPGRITDLPWAMVFPNIDDQPRHPSQLYQFALEGLALFALLWWFASRRRPRAAVSALFLIGYGVFRFIAEFARAPDEFLGLLAFGMTMGQWLSIPMVLAGAAMMAWAYRRSSPDPPG
jgi:phosphatidylglycerol:prolipoprotein diacylglycerol transferase